MNEDVEEKKPRKKRIPRRHKRFGLWTPLSIIVLAAALVFAVLSVSGRTLTAPDWMTDQIELQINDGLPTGRISLNRVTMQVDDNGVPRVLLRDVSVFDDRGSEIARLNEVGARFSLALMAKGQMQPETLRLSGAQMTLRRLRDGQFDLSFGGGATTSDTLAGILDSLDEAFFSGALANTKSVKADALTISVEDARSGRIWQITEGSLNITPTDNNLDMSVSFDVFNGTEELAETTLSIITDRASPAASIGANFKNAAAADIALQSPALSFLGVLDAPISGALRADFNTEGTLGSLAGTLEIEAGALQPSAQTKPVRFDDGRAYFRFDPAKNKITFSELSVRTEAASLSSSGHAYLREFNDGWPSVLLGQFSLSDLIVQSEELPGKALRYSEGAADFRLRLNPFTFDLGQMVLVEGEERVMADGRVFAGEKGWELASDVQINAIAHDQLLSLWPVSLLPKTRKWISENIAKGTLTDIHGALRMKPEIEPRMALGYHFNDATVRYIKTLPEITGASGYSTIDGRRFSVTLENGTVTPPMGGAIDLTGSAFTIGDVTMKPATADLRLRGKSSATAALSLLNEPPFKILKNASFGPDLATGRAEFSADVGFKMVKKVELPDVDYSVRADLINISTDKLVKGRNLQANRLALVATPESVEISGPAKFGLVPANIKWVQMMGPEYSGKSGVTGTAQLSQAFVDEFGIGLPAGSVSGQGNAAFDIALRRGEAPRFTLQSDLRGVGLKIAPLGWAKSRNSSGNLVVEGQLGDRPVISRLDVSASGLNASGGQVSLTPDGQLQTASFARVTAGGWLDAPVVLSGRGKGATPAVSLPGGSIDIRQTTFGNGGGSGKGGPISLALNRLVVSEGITLTGFRGDFKSGAGFEGTFSGRVNGKARLTGRLVPEAKGSAIRIQSANAGGVFRDAGVLKQVQGGDMNLILRPRGAKGEYNGTLKVTNTRVVGASALAELLSAISIVGLIDQINGPGIAFSEVDAAFVLTPRAITLKESSAVGPSLGISLDGLYDLASSRMDMQGVISPVYFLNGIGQIFSRRGEGLFGFNFRLTGAAPSPKVQVNPLSILTPGMFRDIFRKPPPVAN